LKHHSNQVKTNVAFKDYTVHMTCYNLHMRPTFFTERFDEMNRRSFLKQILGSALTLIGLGGGTYYYAREIEPTLLSITENTIQSSKIPTDFQNYKIIQFTDTHIGFHYSIEQLKELVSKINAENPDIILFTGDLVDVPHSFKWDGELIETLSSLQAPDGKYWIYGNHDHGGFGTNKIKDVMSGSDFTLLQNSSVIIRKGDGRMNIAGLDDVMLGQPDLNKTFHGLDTDLFTILLVHEPDYADKVADYPADVQISGHSHGGQVRFPFIGHLYTPAFAEKYVKGEFQLDDNFTLYVSKGIGTTRLPYRFLCKPELNVYTLKSQK